MPITASWEDWQLALDQFSRAARIVVSAYDKFGVRQVGPLLASPLSVFLNTSSMWSEVGEGTRLERKLVVCCFVCGLVLFVFFCFVFCVFVTPIMRFGVACGAIVYGWAFSTFASGIGCERIAKLLSLPGARMWATARLEPPVAPARMETYTELLKTLIAFTATQAEAIERLNVLGRMREVFLASVSHEMRTPLSAISLRLELLLHGKLDDPQAIRSALTSMVDNVRQEARLIEDLIDASRTRTGQLHIFPERVILQNILRQAVTTVEPQAKLKKVALSIGALGEDDVPVWADALRLQQLFWNLISNAVKFTPAAGKVEILVRTGRDFHEIKKQNTGVYNTTKTQPQKNEKNNKQTTNKKNGLGLGLSIAKHIAELHGGSIYVANTGVLKGTTFTVSLPAMIHAEA